VTQLLNRVEVDGFSSAKNRRDTAEKLTAWNRWVAFQQSVAAQEVKRGWPVSYAAYNSVDAKFAGTAVQNNVPAARS
jgi:hypothetical protein